MDPHRKLFTSKDLPSQLRLSIGQVVLGQLTYVTNGRSFAVQPAVNESSLKEIADLCEALPEDCPDNDSVIVGTLWGAIFEDDHLWYRALIQSVDRENKLATVYFIDYGNSDTVNMDCGLRWLPEDLLKFPPQILECQWLHAGVTDDREATSRLDALLDVDQITMTVVETKFPPAELNQHLGELHGPIVVNIAEMALQEKVFVGPTLDPLIETEMETSDSGTEASSTELSGETTEALPRDKSSEAKTQEMEASDSGTEESSTERFGETTKALPQDQDSEAKTQEMEASDSGTEESSTERSGETTEALPLDQSSEAKTQEMEASDSGTEESSTERSAETTEALPRDQNSEAKTQGVSDCKTVETHLVEAAPINSVETLIAPSSDAVQENNPIDTSTATPIVGTVPPASSAAIVSTITPAMVAPIIDSVTPAMVAPIIDAVTPAMIAPIIDAVTPAMVAPIIDAVTPAMVAWIMDAVTPAMVARIMDAVTPAMVAPIIDAVTPAIVAPIIDAVTPEMVAPIIDAVTPEMVAPIIDAVTPATESPSVVTSSPVASDVAVPQGVTVPTPNDVNMSETALANELSSTKALLASLTDELAQFKAGIFTEVAQFKSSMEYKLVQVQSDFESKLNDFKVQMAAQRLEDLAAAVASRRIDEVDGAQHAPPHSTTEDEMPTKFPSVEEELNYLRVEVEASRAQARYFSALVSKKDQLLAINRSELSEARLRFQEACTIKEAELHVLRSRLDQ